MGISTDREKKFDKMWYLFMVETLDKLEMKGIFLILIYRAFVKTLQRTSYFMGED